MTALTQPRLTDLFAVNESGCSARDNDCLAVMIRDGYVRVQHHPTLPLRILNYTEKTAYEGRWNPVTRACRGLIVNDLDQVVARPFPKFFNHGQPGAAEIGLAEPVVALDKVDGSLGVIYPTPDGFAVATRGSFTSEQAIHATGVLRTRYPQFLPPDGMTVLVEIVYPENRIVVSYDFDDLVLLGGVDIADGKVRGPSAVRGWDGPAAASFDGLTFGEALAMPPRPNAEGLVVRSLRTGEILKLKQADYVALHRIVTGLNARTVWEHLVKGEPLADLVAPLPDEFHDWVRSVAEGIDNAVLDESWRLVKEYAGLLDQMPEGWQPGTREARAVFARLAAQHPDKWAMFNLLDGADIRPELVKRAKPEPYVTPYGRTYTEENA